MQVLTIYLNVRPFTSHMEQMFASKHRIEVHVKKVRYFFLKTSTSLFLSLHADDCSIAFVSLFSLSKA